MSKYKDGGLAVTLDQSRRRRAAAAAVTTITTSTTHSEDAFQMPQLRNKRKAGDSPNKMMDKALKVVKRSALGNVTNAVVSAAAAAAAATTTTTSKKTVLQQIDNLKIENKLPKNQSVITKPVTRASTRNKTTTAAAAAVIPAAPRAVAVPKNKSKNKENVAADSHQQPPPPSHHLHGGKPPTRRISNEFDRTGDTLYMSAIDLSDSRVSLNSTAVESGEARRRSVVKHESVKEEHEEEEEEEAADDDTSTFTVALDQASVATLVEEGKAAEQVKGLVHRGPMPAGVTDFDLETRADCFQLGDYAMDIFDYLRSKEREFPVRDYIAEQPVISKWMRSLLVDWMVEVQESFELNHETLYLAVKLVDLYLGQLTLSKEKLQLLGAAAMFIACKFDERIPPYIDDFLYICDGAYTRKELIEMERSVFRAVQFNLGMPLSYRFLRRYARCAKIVLPSLTLARYILEYGLMDYETITRSDSKLAAAALYIALKMLTPSDDAVWSDTLRYYAGYELAEFAAEVVVLNDNLNRKTKEKTLNTIKKKYGHKIFYEVALKPHLSNELLFRGTGVVPPQTTTSSTAGQGAKK